MKKLLYLIILVSHFSFGESFKSQLDTNAILIGQQIKFSLKASNINSEIVWPNISDSIFDGIELISSSNIDTSIDGNNISFFQEFIITAWDSGVYYIPSFSINEQLKSEGFLLNVFSIQINENDTLKDIKSQIEPRFNLLDYWVLILTALIVLCLILVLKKYYKKDIKQSKAIEIQPTIAPNVIALKSLEELEKDQLWQSGKIKKYHSKISEIIRSYIEARFKVIALELTTDEIIMNIRNKTSADNIKELNKILARADLAKFAKSKPIDLENEESMLIAIKFVEQTTEIKDDE